MKRWLFNALCLLVYGLLYPLILWEAWRLRRQQAKWLELLSRRPGGADTKGGE